MTEDRLSELEATVEDIVTAIAASGDHHTAARIRARIAARQAQRDKAAKKGA